MVYPAMEIWGCVAIAIPTTIAGLIAYYCQRRSFVAAGFLGAVVGLLFRGLSIAVYDEPFDDLKQTLADSLPSTMLLSMFGVCLAGIMLHRIVRPTSRT